MVLGRNDRKVFCPKNAFERSVVDWDMDGPLISSLPWKHLAVGTFSGFE
jgi:hypothetical protein